MLTRVVEVDGKFIPQAKTFHYELWSAIHLAYKNGSEPVDYKLYKNVAYQLRDFAVTKEEAEKTVKDFLQLLAKHRKVLGQQ